MWRRWTFFDPSAAVTYTMPINPNTGGVPAVEKTITEVATIASNGAPLLFEGADKPPSWEISGILHAQAEHDALRAWWAKHRQVKVTDDTGREYWVYIRQLDLTRKPTRQHLWRHEFKITASILDWPN